MAVVPENQRLEELRRLGLSEPLIRLASGVCIHPMFRNGCLGPPYFVYHGADTPEGPSLVALWDCNDTVVGVWERPDGLEFIDFSIEACDECRPIARTEQGFWAAQFDFLYECEIPDQELREAAATVGFRFLDQLVASKEAAAGRQGSYDGHAGWLRDVVAELDRR